MSQEGHERIDWGEEKRSSTHKDKGVQQLPLLLLVLHEAMSDKPVCNAASCSHTMPLGQDDPFPSV